MSHESAGRQYRVVYYGSNREVYEGTVTLRWHWDWRLGLDPLYECWQAQQAKESLAKRAQAIADRVNEEISLGASSNRRFDLVGAQDRIDGDQLALIRADLVAIQLSTAHLSCLAVKAALRRLAGDGAA
ncbi:MAG: hypothetical protein NW201_12490 [Gemmatimonadales bacterium]|nr:hypothetical protein [Gemmatimonadales bacterium]